MVRQKLRVAFVHPDLGIGGAERLVVDAALGLQRLGHSVDIYTSHHDPMHCFEETRNGTLRVHNISPPFPRSFGGKLHILLAHLRQLHLTTHILKTAAHKYDVFFVDQLSTCIPILRECTQRRLVFYCHFPDKLLADGGVAVVDGSRRNVGLLKRLYRFPMDWLEEVTTGCADVLLANSNFTAQVFRSQFSIPRTPRVVYPGINLSAYNTSPVLDENTEEIQSSRPTLLSLNRFEGKKNAALAVESFALLRTSNSTWSSMRLVIAGGYDPRLRDNIDTLKDLIYKADAHELKYWVTMPPSDKFDIKSKPNSVSLSPPSSTARSASSADIIFLLNFSTAQRSALLTAASTVALLYTPANEHFGIGPVEGMVCGLPVLACNSGGPTESVVASPPEERTGWLLQPEPKVWAKALEEVLSLDVREKKELGRRARERAEKHFGMNAMAESLETALYEAVEMGPVEAMFLGIFMMLLAGFVAVSLAYWLVYM